ncbi:MAG: hypothetical protein HQK49_07090 [Oligoflexia bacterium]|nr:hypothetical protein [Oligoflexia bacterium]
MIEESFAVMEFSGGYSYSKQAYGEDKHNTMKSTTYSGGIAVYIWSYTGLELNYSYTTDIISEKDRHYFGGGVYIVSVYNEINTRMYGAGVRQILAPLSSFIVPAISLGYARQIQSGGTTYILEDLYGNQGSLYATRPKDQSDNCYATFALKIRATKYFMLNGSVKTVFRAFRFSEAEDYIKYEAGFSLLF